MPSSASVSRSAVVPALVLLSAARLWADPAPGPATNAATAGNADLAAAQRRLRAMDGLKLDLWAAEPLVRNLTSVAFDEQGRAYAVETGRRRTSVFDVRNFKDWVEDDLALRTVPDRLRFLTGQLATNAAFRAAATRGGQGGFRDFNGDGTLDVRDLAVETEDIRLVWDSDGDGRADKSLVFAENFSGPVSGVAAGVLAEGTNVWFACIPDLWRLGTGDPARPAAATSREALHTGFGVHVAFGGHDLHGLVHGPDGRLYFSIADRGANVTNREGAVIACPDSGAVFRCEPDGRGLELYARGLRNPQELAFDAEGNLWTGDNNGDGGDKARWTLVTEGADHGWTIGWQWLARMGAWNSERLWQLPGTNTAAYLVPPVAHVGHGPAGIAYYPGTGLGPRFDGTFLMADFPGGVRVFRVERRGGWFAVAGAGPWLEDNSAARMEGKLLWDLSPVDVAFPPDGGVVVADWVEGWEKTGKGRLWKLTDPSLAGDARIAAVRTLLAAGGRGRGDAELVALLGHDDLRVRQMAQFELASRGAASWDVLVKAASDPSRPAVRRHALRGLRQLVRTPAGRARLEADAGLAARWLGSGDAAVALEACRLLGDARLAAAGPALRARFADADVLVASEAMHAFRALAPAERGGDAWAGDLLKAGAGGRAANPLFRHAASRLLASHAASGAPVAAWETPADPDARLVAVLALRGAGSPRVAAFLGDADPQVALEAARAIHDVPIEPALGALAALLDRGLGDAGRDFGSRPRPYTRDEWRGYILRRALNAATRLGGVGQVASIAAVAADAKAPEALRVEALEALGGWGAERRRDPVTGLIRPRPAQDPSPARAAVATAWPSLADDAAGPATKRAAIAAARALAVPGLAALLAPLSHDADPEVRAAATTEAAEPADSPDRAVAGSDPSEPAKLLLGGNAARGRRLFVERADWGCQRCHKLGGEGGDVGPELAGIGARKGRAYVLESIVRPNKVIADGFESVLLTLKDDATVAGVLKEDNVETIVVQTPEQGRVVVRKSEVKSRDRAASAMPDGLGELMTRAELRDLVEALSAEAGK